MPRAMSAPKVPTQQNVEYQGELVTLSSTPLSVHMQQLGAKSFRVNRTKNDSDYRQITFLDEGKNTLCQILASKNAAPVFTEMVSIGEQKAKANTQAKKAEYSEQLVELRNSLQVLEYQNTDTEVVMTTITLISSGELEGEVEFN